ncbi:MAG: CopZ family metallochaperone [Acidiferrobacteraceae bacterium]
MESITLRISGMTCGHCVNAVTKALQSVPGVRSANVSLELEEAVIQGAADAQTLLQAVRGQGYSAEVKR